MLQRSRQYQSLEFSFILWHLICYALPLALHFFILLALSLSFSLFSQSMCVCLSQSLSLSFLFSFSLSLSLSLSFPPIHVLILYLSVIGMREQGLSLDKYASINVKVLVVANPANTNMLVLLKTDN